MAAVHALEPGERVIGRNRRASGLEQFHVIAPARLESARGMRGFAHMGEFSDRLVGELIDAVKAALKKEHAERLRDVYLIGDIDKDTARAAIERIRELASESTAPITLYLNTAGGNVTDGLALHDAILQIVSQGREVVIVVQGMAYSMG